MERLGVIATLAFVPRGVRHVETDGALLLSGDVDNGWPFQRVERLRTRANRRAVDRGFGKMKAFGKDDAAEACKKRPQSGGEKIQGLRQIQSQLPRKPTGIL